LTTGNGADRYRRHGVAELRLAKRDHIAVLEARTANPTPVHEYTVCAPRIPEKCAARGGNQHRMMTADGAHCERQTVVGIAANGCPRAQDETVVLAAVDARQDACLSLCGRALGGSQAAAQLVDARLHPPQGVGVRRGDTCGSAELSVPLRQGRVQLLQRRAQLHIHRLGTDKAGIAVRCFFPQLSDPLLERTALLCRRGQSGGQLPGNNSQSLFPYGNSPNNVVFDYTADGVRRSIEDSLQRLGIDRIDVAFVHDISSDNLLLPTPWQDQFAIALKGAFPTLSRMREEGIIRGWGIGVNTPEPILRVMQESDPDVCLLASQYSLIDHANALNNVFPVARAQGVGFVIGSALNAGFLSGSARYNYGKNSWNISRDHITKREPLRAVADEFGVDLRTAALQFSAAPDVAVALVVGAHTATQVLANASSMQATIPPTFWAELKRQNLMERNSPVPVGGT